MNYWMLGATLAAVATVPADAHHRKAHHRAHHHHPVAAAVYPDSVTLEGKDYKVCKPGMQDDCVQPRAAGLDGGKAPASGAHPHHPGRHR